MEIINGTCESILQSSSDVVCSFSEKLNFCELYNFKKSQKLFIHNKNISHTSCLCDTWQNNALLAKGLDICKKILWSSSRNILWHSQKYSSSSEKKIRKTVFKDCTKCVNGILCQFTANVNNDKDSHSVVGGMASFYR